jgi:MarR family transcriptional regulator, organic hydroperoxide resistance regulator
MLEAIDPDEALSLDNQLCFALSAAARQVVSAYRPALADLGITHTQYLVLLVLWEWARKREPRPTLKALGNRLLLDSGTLTPLLKRMQGTGLITRTRSTEDEREVFVRLTPAGLELKKRAKRIPISLLEQAPLPLGDIVSLRIQLKRLSAALQPIGEAGSLQPVAAAVARPSPRPRRKR